MKKLISLVLILCMACTLIPAMAEEDVTGDWYAHTMIQGEQVIDIAAMGMSVKMTLNADGTGAMDMNGQITELTWTQDGSTVTVTTDGKPASGTLEDGALTLADENMTMVFTREATEAITVAPVKAAASAEEFYGEYIIALMDMDGQLVNLAVQGAATGLKVSADAFEIVPANDEDAIALMLGLFALTPTGFEDGALKLVSTLTETVTGIAELLEDGMLKLTAMNTETQDGLTVYFAPAAAEEAPAA